VNTGGADSINPNRAITRSAARGTGSANTGTCTGGVAMTAETVAAQSSSPPASISGTGPISTSCAASTSTSCS